jgi:hypothetical protein
MKVNGKGRTETALAVVETWTTVTWLSVRRAVIVCESVVFVIHGLKTFMVLLILVLGSIAVLPFIKFTHK